MNDITYRPGDVSDALCVGVLGTQVFLDTYAPEGTRPGLAREVLGNFSMPAIQAQMENPWAAFLLAERAGHLIGFAQLTHGARHLLVPHVRAAELNRLYIHERFTSTGIGTELLRRAETLAARHGAAAIWLTAWVGNQRAVLYYPRRGYQDVGASIYSFEDDHYENRVFVKVLEQGGSASPRAAG
ncbi:MAG: GNAT family N-acetyltransferase [Ramlibacter sp.]|nr:GNAT family N-acetyltransferase [Ramlibacter sp.]